MNYRLLGQSGLRVSELCLGTMTFGEDWGWGSPREEARKIYDAFREAGGNFIDTANLYILFMLEDRRPGFSFKKIAITPPSDVGEAWEMDVHARD